MWECWKALFIQVLDKHAPKRSKRIRKREMFPGSIKLLKISCFKETIHYADGGLKFRTNSFDDFCRSIARDLRNAEQQKYHHSNQHKTIY